MSKKPINVVAQFKAKPGKEAEMRKELLSMLAPSRKDEGCLSYDLHQVVGNPAVLVFVESWACKDSLDKHLAKPDFKVILGRVEKLIAEPLQLALLEKIG